MNRSRTEFGLALLLDLIGAAGAVLWSTRVWQTVLTPRPRPLADDVLRLSGRTLDATCTALAVVALAGVVAVLATRGLARRIVGLAVALAGAGLVWRALAGLGAVSADRARGLVGSRHSGVGLDATVVPQVTVHAAWPWLTAVCGVLVAIGGAVVAARGQHWSAMSARYDAPSTAVSGDDAERARQRANASLWQQLDRGHDPTAHQDPAP